MIHEVRAVPFVLGRRKTSIIYIKMNKKNYLKECCVYEYVNE